MNDERMVTCPSCNGSGQVNVRTTSIIPVKGTCQRCRGVGRIKVPTAKEQRPG